MADEEPSIDIAFAHHFWPSLTNMMDQRVLTADDQQLAMAVIQTLPIETLEQPIM